MFFYPPKICTFVEHEILSDTFYSIKHSKSYRIGQLILFFPKMLTKFIKIFFQRKNK